MTRTPVKSQLVWLASRGRDEIFSPPAEEGHHAKLVSRVTPSGGSVLYLVVRQPDGVPGRHRARFWYEVLPADAAELVPVRRDAGVPGKWYRTGGGWPSGTDRYL